MHLSRSQTQRIAFILIGLAAILTAAPIIIVVSAIFISGASAISWQFLLEMPSDGMRSGGMIEVLSGVDRGTPIVADGTVRVRDDAAVAATFADRKGEDAPAGGPAAL